MSVSPSTQTELEAYAFRQLVAHLQSRPDVQNIDQMNLAGFCRNCLSKWYLRGARESCAEAARMIQVRHHRALSSPR